MSHLRRCTVSLGSTGNHGTPRDQDQIRKPLKLCPKLGRSAAIGLVQHYVGNDDP